MVQAAIPAYVACPADDPATHSRWYRPTPGPVAWDGSVGPQAYEILHAMPLRDAVLIPSADNAAPWQDSRNRQFRILEINTRAWWHVEFAMHCGVNMCKLAFEDANAMPVTPS